MHHKTNWLHSLLPALLLAWSAGVAQPGRAAEHPAGGRVSGCEHLAFQRAKVAEGLGGPAREACKSWHVSMCVDGSGTAYALDAENCQVYRIQEGTVRVLAGDGIRGYRDGPADRARFDFGVGSYQDADVKADTAGNLYVAEGVAGRIRKIYRDADGLWQVTTLSGGGDRMPGPGESIPATEMQFGGSSRFALKPDGTVYFATHSGVYRIRDGRGTLVTGHDALDPVVGKSINDWHVGGSHVTPDGWFYWMPGGGPDLLRVHVETGKAERFAGVGKLAPGLDGPTLLTSGFHTVFVAYTPDGRIMCTGGGDESILRRIKDGRPAHLQKDGTFLPGGKENGWHLYSPLCFDPTGRLYTETGIYAWGGFVVRVTFGHQRQDGDGRPNEKGTEPIRRSGPKGSSHQSAPPASRSGRPAQRQPAGAFGKGVYLVAWCEDSRQADRPTADVYCARIEPRTGKLLDPEGIAVCSALDLQEWPAVSFDGTNFLVAWQDFRSGERYDIYAARVTPEGKVLDRDGFPVAVQGCNQARPGVAFAAGRHVVTWMDARRYPVYGVYAARVTPGGEVLDREGIALDVEDAEKIAELRPPGPQWMGDRDYWWDRLASRYLPLAASDGRQCLVVYTRDRPFASSGRPTPSALLFDPEQGEVTAGPAELPGGAHDTYAACATPQGWAVVLMDHAHGWGLAPRLAAVRLDADLQTADAFAKPHSQQPDRLPVVPLDKRLMPEGTGTLNPGKGAVAFWRPAAAFNGREVVVATDFGWRERRDANAIARVIAVNRLAPGAPRFTQPACTIAASTDRADQSVANPALIAGPAGETLLLYEQDESVDRQVIESRVLEAE